MGRLSSSAVPRRVLHGRAADEPTWSRSVAVSASHRVAMPFAPAPRRPDSDAWWSWGLRARCGDWPVVTKAVRQSPITETRVRLAAARARSIEDRGTSQADCRSQRSRTAGTDGCHSSGSGTSPGRRARGSRSGSPGPRAGRPASVRHRSGRYPLMIAVMASSFYVPVRRRTSHPTTRTGARVHVSRTSMVVTLSRRATMPSTRCVILLGL